MFVVCGAVNVGAALTNMTAVGSREQNTVDGFIEPHVNRLSLENNTVLVVLFCFYTPKAVYLSLSTVPNVCSRRISDNQRGLRTSYLTNVNLGNFDVPFLRNCYT